MDIEEVINRIELFIERNGVNKGRGVATYTVVRKVEKVLDINFGPQLIQYVMEYGYLGYDSIELFGIYTINAWEHTDMVKETLYLRHNFPATQKLVALENRGDGDYFLVDSDDYVYEYDTEVDELRKTNQTLFEYILSRFKSVY